MSTGRKHLWAWALLAIATGAFLAACFSAADSPGLGLDLAFLLPVLFLGLVLPEIAGRRAPNEEFFSELDPFLFAAPSRAPPA